MKKRDNYGVPATLGTTASGDLKPIRVGDDGSLISGGSRRLKEVVALDLGTSRENELFEKSFSEITIANISGSFSLRLDSLTGTNMTINKAMSIETAVDRFYISNGSGSGYAELWLWE